MSKSHKKHFRVPSALSTPSESTSSAPSKLEEPIKLERVLLSDEFYWAVPGDVPASDKRYGMRMVPQATPKPGTSINSKTDVSSQDKAKEEVDTNRVEQDSSTRKNDKISIPFIAENKNNSEISSQLKKQTIDRSENNSSKSITEVQPTASILSMTDTGRFDTALKPEPVQAETKIKSDRSYQQTVSSNKKAKEETSSLGNRYQEKSNKAAFWKKRKVWFVLPLLLLLASFFYDSPNTNDSLIANTVEIKAHDLKKISISKQTQEFKETTVTNTEVAQVKQIHFITHVVVKGDTLWDISSKYLNNPFRYPEVAKLSEVKNPHLIYPGDIIRIQIEN